MNWLSRNWQLLNANTIGFDSYWHIAVQNKAAMHDTKRLIKSYVNGKVLDIGAGKLAWRSALSPYLSSYTSADFAKEHADLDLIFDATKTFPLSSESFDSLFCYSVLEHTPKPWNVVPELYRVLKPGGCAILSVPFIFYLHGAPYDYYRFTKYGISNLVEEAGFVVDKQVLSGGIFHFLLNAPSVVFSALLYSLRLDFCIPFITSALTFCARVLDNLFDPSGMFAMNIILVLRKK